MLRHWSQALPLASGKQRVENFLPQALRTALPVIETELAGLARLVHAHRAADGSERLLVGLADGQTVESVLLPKGGLCISSQVGCAVGCVFCMTGRGGLVRHLGSAEMVAQVALARTRRPVSKVVSWAWANPRTTSRTSWTRSSCSGSRAISATRTWCSPRSATRAYSSAWRKAP